MSKPYPVQEPAGSQPEKVPLPTEKGTTDNPPPYAPPQAIQPPVAVFNQDAALDPNKPINVPPPPPGYQPTAAQQAFAQGGSVHIVQEKKDMLGGGSDGGVTIW